MTPALPSEGRRFEARLDARSSQRAGFASRVLPFLGVPGACEGGDGTRREPERVDDTPVLNTALGARLA